MPNEFHRPCRGITDSDAKRLGGFQKPCAYLSRQIRRGSLLNHLLITPLKGTVTLTKRGDRAQSVAEDFRGRVSREADRCIGQGHMWMDAHRTLDMDEM